MIYHTLGIEPVKFLLIEKKQVSHPNINAKVLTLTRKMQIPQHQGR